MKTDHNHSNKMSVKQPPYKVALIGAGKTADVFLNQVTKYYPQIQIAAVVNRNPEKAMALLKKYGLNSRPAANANELDRNVGKRITSLTSNLQVIGEASCIDAFIEITGTIEFAAKAALTAIRYKKHFINFNSEMDSTLGPILNEKAREAGIIYTGSDGDQPGVTMNLFNYIKALGMQPLVCGSNKGMIDYYRTPETQEKFAQKWNISPHMVTSFADGTKVAMEQCCIANATGMKVEKRGMRGEEVSAHVDDCLSLYDIEKLKKLGGAVDFLLGAKPGPGVYIYATTDDPMLKEQLAYLKMGDGPLYSFYTPFHLCGLDLPITVMKVMQAQKPVFTPLGAPTVEVITMAKKDLKAGQQLDGAGRFTVYGICENAEQAWKENLLPVGLTDEAVLKRDIPKDQPITFDDVEIPASSVVLNLYLEQKKLINAKDKKKKMS